MCTRDKLYIQKAVVEAFTEDPMEISEEVFSEEVLLEEAGSSGGGRKLWKFLKNIKTVQN